VAVPVLASRLDQLLDFSRCEVLAPPVLSVRLGIVTVRFSLAGVTSRNIDLVMEYEASGKSSVRIEIRNQTV
jgi:hypothetical protein